MAVHSNLSLTTAVQYLPDGAPIPYQNRRRADGGGFLRRL